MNIVYLPVNYRDVLFLVRNMYSSSSREWLLSHVESIYRKIDSELLSTSPFLNGNEPGIEDALLFGHLVRVLTQPESAAIGKICDTFPTLRIHVESICGLYFRETDTSNDSVIKWKVQRYI